MSFGNEIERIEKENSQSIEEIYSLVEQAEQVEPLLLPEANRYSNYIDGYRGEEPERTGSQQEIAYASESMIAHESVHLVELVERHEALLENLREGIEDLDYCNDRRYIEGGEVRKDRLKKRMGDLIQDYEEDLQQVMAICSRTVPDEELPDPLEIKSKRARRSLHRREKEESLLGSDESLGNLFAD